MLSGIPEATNRKTIPLIVGMSEEIAIGVTQVEAPGIARIVLRRTPPVTVVANVAEWTTSATATARKT